MCGKSFLGEVYRADSSFENIELNTAFFDTMIANEVGTNSFSKLEEYDRVMYYDSLSRAFDANCNTKASVIAGFLVYGTAVVVHRINIPA